MLEMWWICGGSVSKLDQIEKKRVVMNRYSGDGTDAQLDENLENDGFPMVPSAIYNLRREER